MKECQVTTGTFNVGPSWFFESRTATAVGSANATSTQFPSSELKLLLRHIMNSIVGRYGISPMMSAISDRVWRGDRATARSLCHANNAGRKC